MASVEFLRCVLLLVDGGYVLWHGGLTAGIRPSNPGTSRENTFWFPSGVASLWRAPPLKLLAPC